MSSVSSIVATAIAALLPLAGVTGPFDAQEMLSQPESATSSENLPSGELAVQRELALATQELGHEFMTIRFEGNDTAHIVFLETYNPDTDQAAVDRVMNALATNGYDRVDAVA